ncbi:hypothetical protein FB45DRAFT_409832 [Roridomyces roridus]|uniref:RlpA-like protein double-psi beta-barrel domain-containing protein n=1 Tax=Roridomyces roridus TaxID=1738132 RepID=A0AAD7C4H3_9AGAR|nr:hypothetical protein FB45DRAFT_409832 [Roridomyces roridus]
MTRLAMLALSLLSIIFLPTLASAVSINHSSAKSRYTQPHSLGDSYAFDPRDGWQSLNASSSHSQHRRGTSEKVVPAQKSGFSLFGVAQVMGAVINGLRGQGDSEPVTITWYTGKDLLNPSCWSNTEWAPTDSSFVCALTLEGWQNKPQCFKFIEVCKGPSKCVFVRVVDSCAGCADASHHIDMTKGAFSVLEDPDQGTATVMARPASGDPDSWYEDLWGPQT